MSQAPRICFIAPSKSLEQRALRVIKDGNGDIGVYQAYLDEAVSLGAELVRQGAEIIISRKVTRNVLQETLSVPVLDIPTMLPDYFELIHQALTVNGFVAFFSAGVIPAEVSTLCLLLNIEIRNYPFSNSDEARSAVRQAHADGAAFGVGYSYTSELAARVGLPYVYLSSSEASILESIESAREILRASDRERKVAKERQLEYEQLMSVFRATKEGLISVDKEGRIETLNQMAEDILGISLGEVKGRKITELVKDAPAWKAVVTGTIQTDDIYEIRGRKVVSTSVPIMVDNEIMGAVSVFKHVDVLQDSEHRVRAALYNKGLYAKYNFNDIVGNSPAMQRTLRLAGKYAQSSSTVLIYGETGVGKELFAQSIHNSSPRRSAPFVAINCAALDPNLLESELFGYMEGSFTGALKGGKVGLFEAAHGGTIFLDEISAMPFSLQAKLLRVLQEREVRRIGSSKVVKIDVRVIAATNQNLAEAVQLGNFRSDLFYRLNVLYLEIPPLRDRDDDYRVIGNKLFKKMGSAKYQTIFDKALRKLAGHSWPGNVRELSNFCECAASLLTEDSDTDILDSLICQVFTNASLSGGSLPISPSYSREKERILEALRRNDFVINKAAEDLGISRTTLWRRMKKHNIETD